jgi:mono/diheme cytochrome c family protein
MRAMIIVALVLASAAHGKDLLDQAPMKSRAAANPYGHDESAKIAGAKLYRRECAACHGETRLGLGSAPALIQLAGNSDRAGAIFWVLRNGHLRRGMPSFAHLPAPQRWQMITYLTAPAPH